MFHTNLVLTHTVFKYPFGLQQVSKSLRVTPGAGLADGDTLERLWSYLRCFASMTKEMGASKRLDLLTDALIYYCRKERDKLGEQNSVLLVFSTFF